MKYIVDFHNDAPDADINKYLADNGCTVLKEWNNFDKVYLVEAAAEPPAATIVAHVVDDSNKVAMKPLGTLDVHTYTRMFNPNLPSITIDTQAEKDWWKNYTLSKPVFDAQTTQISRKGSHVSVYIMDSGILATHPDFVDTSITNLYSVTGEFGDTTGHGTAIASLIAGKECGITNAKLKIVKIFDHNHETLQSEFLDALDAILADHVDGTFSVLNASWSIPRNQWVEYKLRELMDEGVWTMAAAGNSGHAIEDVTPAAMTEAFTVGAYNSNLVPSDFSDYTGATAVSLTNGPVNGGVLNGWAPGEQMYIAALNGGYNFAAGTSMACAIASAVAAYNLHDACNDNGTMFPQWQGVILAGPDANGTVFIVGRPDLLDLSDPKYVNSTNLITTLFEMDPGMVKPCTDEAYTSVRVGAPQSIQRVFDPHSTKSFEIISGWPSFAIVNPDGTVWADPKEADGPQGSEPYKLYETTFKRTNLQDVEETVKYDIYVLASNFQPSDIPEDHVIQITLLGNCLNFPYVSCIISTNPACFSACPGGGCCDAKGFQCVCANAFGYEEVEEWIG